MEDIPENIVDLVKQHPEGIPIKRLAVFYSQTYHKNLEVSSLGFDSTANLVETLSLLVDELVVEGELVFHRDHRTGSEAGAAAAGSGASAKAPKAKKKKKKNQAETLSKVQENSRPTTPQTPGSRTSSPAPFVNVTPRDASPHVVPETQARINLVGSPLISTPSLFASPYVAVNPIFAVPQIAEKLTQEQLYQRVLEVSCVKILYTLTTIYVLNSYVMLITVIHEWF